MIQTIVKVVSPRIKVAMSMTRLVVKFPVSIPGPPGSAGAPDFSLIPEYTDDEAAIADGLSVGDFYIIADGSDVGPSGMLKKVRPIT